MPLFWSSVDTQYASICAAVPASAAVFGTLYAANDAKIVNFLKGQQYPKKLAPSCQFFYLGMNVATVAPYGYASYLVYKIGGGFDYTDTTVALILYGATIGTGLSMIRPLYSRNVKLLAVTNGVLAALALATAVAFYKIDNISGYWAIPFSLWTLYCAAVNTKVSGYCNEKVAIE